MEERGRMAVAADRCWLRSCRAWALGLLVLAAAGCGGGGSAVGPSSTELDALETLFDFSAQEASARPLRETGRIDPGSAEGSGLLVAGWGRPEVDPGTGRAFVWAISTTATLEPILLRSAVTTLRFVCRPFAYQGAPAQTVELVANGVPVGAVTLDRRTRAYSMTIPAERVRPGRNQLELRFAHAASPSRVEAGSDDRRSLAAAFDELELVPAGAARGAASGAPAVGSGGLVLPAGTGLAFTVAPHGEIVLDLGAGRDGASGLVAWFGAPGGDKQVVVRGRRGYPPVAIRWPEGRPLEIGFAAAGTEPVAIRPRLVGRGARVRTPANLLVVVVDTLRADHVGAYRAGARTPAIDGLAAAGTLFERVYSHIAITGPSHASLFTSLLPFEHGVRNNAQILDGSAHTLAETLRARGWMTAAVVSLGVLRRDFGFDQGFDHYRDDFAEDWMKDAGEVNAEADAVIAGELAEPYFLFVHYSDPHEPYTPPDLDYPRVELELDGRAVGAVQANGRSTVVPLELGRGAHTLRFLARRPELEPGRFYKMDAVRLEGEGLSIGRGSWELLESPGSPPTYQSRLPATLELANGSGATRTTELRLNFKQRLDIPEVRVRYSQEVEYADRQIGGLLEALRGRGLLDNTLIVVLSDHGEGLGFHNHVGHIHQVYDTLLRVPLVMSWPGVVPPGKRVADVVSLVDVFPTVAELLGVDGPVPASGRSLAPLLRGEAMLPRAVLAATYRPEAFTDKQAIISGGFKLIRSWSPRREWEELYDLQADPDELSDLVTSHADVADRLRSELADRMASVDEGSSAHAELSEADRERLRALGYLH